MSLSRFAITRPVSTIMIFLAAMLIGVVSLVSLPVELYPNVELTDISIIMIVRGGIPPTEVESLVTKPIEEVVSTVSHLKELLSVSKEGEATIVLSFEPGTNMEYAALEVREKFAKVKNKLHGNTPTRQATAMKIMESTPSPIRVLPMVRIHNQRPLVATFILARMTELVNSPAR